MLTGLALRPALLLLLWAAPLLAASPTVTVTGSSPELPAELASRRALYLRVQYDADQPIRLRAVGYLQGKPAPQAHSNPSPAYPAGADEALAWFSHPDGTAIDELRLEVSSDQWQPLATISVPVQARWTAAAAGLPSEDAAWVADLSQAQQALAVANHQRPEASGWLDAGLMLVFWSVPGYIALQIVTLAKLKGRRRRLAWVPLLGMGPVYAFSLFALTMGANLWPVWLIVASPFACLFLAALLLWPRLPREAYL
jgi:hypothetical protein